MDKISSYEAVSKARRDAKASRPIIHNSYAAVSETRRKAQKYRRQESREDIDEQLEDLHRKGAWIAEVNTLAHTYGFFRKFKMEGECLAAFWDDDSPSDFLMELWNQRNLIDDEMLDTWNHYDLTDDEMHLTDDEEQSRTGGA